MSERLENSDSNLEAPPRLLAALNAQQPLKPTEPGSVDESILAQARAHLRTIASSSPPRVMQFPRPAQWLAAAAAFMLGLGLVFLLRLGDGFVPSVAREDIDRNGRVDILDAFALARRLQSGAAAGSEVDVNGDGVFDQRDIDHIAARAVKVTKG